MDNKKPKTNEEMIAILTASIIVLLNREGLTYSSDNIKEAFDYWNANRR